MSINEAKISERQRNALLSLSEGHFVEKKGILVKPAKLSRSMSGFANSDGGELYIGLEDGGGGSFTWKGFTNHEAANAHIQILESLFPLGHDYVCEFLSCNGESGVILHVTVRKTRSIVPATGGIPYVRRSAQNLAVDTAEKRQQLERNKGITTFESETMNVSPLLVTDSQTVKRFLEEVVPTAPPEDWLRKQQLLQSNLPTVAGVLLFSDLPQATLPKRSGIKISRYKTDAEVGTRETLSGIPESIEGCAYDLIKQAVDRTQNVIDSAMVLSSSGFERIQYPTETLHEVITNAVIHRDYEIADDVHVRIFDNRVEVESPGLLAGHVTVANILSEVFRRNGNLVRVLNKFPDPPNRDIGEGLRTAFDAMRNHRLRDPVIRQTETSVIVEIRHERLAAPEEMVVDFLKNKGTITNTEVRRICGIPSESKAKKVLNRLRDRQQIELVPGLHGSKSAWRLVPAPDHVSEQTPPIEQAEVPTATRDKQMTLFDPEFYVPQKPPTA